MAAKQCKQCNRFLKSSVKLVDGICPSCIENKTKEKDDIKMKKNTQALEETAVIAEETKVAEVESGETKAVETTESETTENEVIEKNDNIDTTTGIETQTGETEIAETAAIEEETKTTDEIEPTEVAGETKAEIKHPLDIVAEREARIKAKAEEKNAKAAQKALEKQEKEEKRKIAAEEKAKKREQKRLEALAAKEEKEKAKFDYSKLPDGLIEVGKRGVTNAQMIPALKKAADSNDVDAIKLLKDSFPAVYESTIKYLDKERKAKVLTLAV